MRKNDYKEKITKESIWNTATATPVALMMPFYGLEAGHFFAETDYCVKREFHDSFLILLTLKGSGSVNGAELSEGFATIIDCHKPHQYMALSPEWEFMWLHFLGKSAADFCGLLINENTTSFPVNSEFKELLSNITDTFFVQNTLNLLNTSAAIQELLHVLFEKSISLIDQSTNSLYMERAIKYMHKNYSEQISVDDISSYVNLSKYHFIRMFKRFYGVTPYAYLINYRITMAKRFLVETEKSVDSIAGECGFLDTANFISKFHQHTGMSPLKYRASSSFIISKK